MRSFIDDAYNHLENLQWISFFRIPSLFKLVLSDFKLYFKEFEIDDFFFTFEMCIFCFLLFLIYSVGLFDIHPKLML